jgi:hypothetical protein
MRQIELSKTSTTRDNQSDCLRSALNPVVHAESSDPNTTSSSTTSSYTARQPTPHPRGRLRRLPESIGNPEPTPAAPSLRISARFIARVNVAKTAEADVADHDPTSYQEAAMREERYN